MLIGPDTTLEEVDGEISRVLAEARALQPDSDAYVDRHVELNHLCRVRDAYTARDEKARGV